MIGLPNRLQIWQHVTQPAPTLGAVHDIHGTSQTIAARQTGIGHNFYWQRSAQRFDATISPAIGSKAMADGRASVNAPQACGLDDLPGLSSIHVFTT
jgi:hypothetical protein